ncbi:MAG: hypothetical protein IJI75_07060 [Solobacterium sp.]|nr:hypothetical protein [Solobacterium sp.]
MFITSELAHLIGVERSFLHYHDRIGYPAYSVQPGCTKQRQVHTMYLK